MPLESDLHTELLHAQWRLVELLELIPPGDARALQSADLELQFAAAAQHLPKLRRWPELPESKLDVYGSPTNAARMYRVCGLLDSTDRLLDIGTNVGYFAGMLATMVKPSAYTGIDLEQSYLNGVRHMAQTNGLDIGHWVLEVGDLYRLTPEWVAKQDPTVVLLLEVLEHLPDPARALKTLAEVMPPEAELLFSVPMLGRLEACWGHHSLFDAERVRQLCADAGLHIHWVEPVVNTWKLVLAGRSELPSPDRIRRVMDSQPPLREPMTIGDPAFRPIALKARTAVVGSGALIVDGKGVTLEASARRRLRRGTTAGMRLPVDGLRALRLELQGIETEGIETVTVEGRTADGAPTCRWEFRPNVRHKLPRKRVTYVFRPGQAAAGYVPTLNENAEATRNVEVSVRLSPGARGSVAVRRASFVG